MWLFFASSYLLGSLPFGVWIARMYGVDILRVGSGNPGATNVQRAVGKGPGLAVFALDVLKGLIPAVVAGKMFQSAEIAGAAGLCAVLGHCLSPFLSFRGGKGISTGLGALLGATPMVGLATFVCFSTMLAVTRYVSLASLISAACLVGFGIAFKAPTSLIIAYGTFAVFLFYRHRSNLQRLRAGTEPKFKWNRGGKTANTEIEYTADLETNPDSPEK